MSTPGVPDAAERRAHPRVASRFTVICRRLGRSGVHQYVDVLDLSMGGVRITAPPALQLGDVVELTVDEGSEPFEVSGLVVSTSSDGDEARYGHIAFTQLTPSTLEHIADLIDSKSQA